MFGMTVCLYITKTFFLSFFSEYKSSAVNTSTIHHSTISFQIQTCKNFYWMDSWKVSQSWHQLQRWYLAWGGGYLKLQKPNHLLGKWNEEILQLQTENLLLGKVGYKIRIIFPHSCQCTHDPSHLCHFYVWKVFSFCIYLYSFVEENRDKCFK